MSEPTKNKISDMITKILLSVVAFFLVQQYTIITDMKLKLDTFYGKQIEDSVVIRNLMTVNEAQSYDIKQLQRRNVERDEWIRDWTETWQPSLNWAQQMKNK